MSIPGRRCASTCLSIPASAALWVQKTASREVAGVGDSVAYEILRRQRNSRPLRRYRPSTPCPPVSGTGAARRSETDCRSPTRRLASTESSSPSTWAIFHLPHCSIRFLVTVGAGTGRDGRDQDLDGLQRGRRPEQPRRGECPGSVLSARAASSSAASAPARATRRTASATGVPGVRVVLEDGTLSISDAKGMFHFEGRGRLARRSLRPRHPAARLRTRRLHTNDRFAGPRLLAVRRGEGGRPFGAQTSTSAGGARPKPAPPPPPPRRDHAPALPSPGRAGGAVPRGRTRRSNAPGLGSASRRTSQRARSGLFVTAEPRLHPGAEEPRSSSPSGSRRRPPRRSPSAAAPPRRPARIGTGDRGDSSAPAGIRWRWRAFRSRTRSRSLKSKQVSMVLRPHFPKFGVSLDRATGRSSTCWRSGRQKLSKARCIVVVGHTDLSPSPAGRAASSPTITRSRSPAPAASGST